MVALTSLLPLVLLLSNASAAGSHLPPQLDRSRIRSVHRRHHARRAETGCNGAVAVGGTPIAVGARASAAAVGNNLIAAPGKTTLSGNGTSTVLPGAAMLVAGSANITSDDAVTIVVEVVKDAVEDVVSPALAKALSTANSGTDNTGSSSSNGNIPSNGIYVVDPSMASSSQPYHASTGSPASQNAAASSYPSPVAQIAPNVYQAAPAASPSPAVSVTCNQGDWRCDGMSLKRCNWNEWILVKQCSGDNIVCSDQGSTVGCVWTWSVAQQAAPVSPSPTVSPSPAINPAPAVNPSPQPSPATTPSSVPTAAQNNVIVNPSPAVPSQESSSTTQTSSTKQQVVGGSSITPAPSSVSTGTSPMPTATFTMADGEVCIEWEEDVWVEEDDDSGSSSDATISITSVASSQGSISTTMSAARGTASVSATGKNASTINPGRTPVPSASASIAYGAQDDDDCEEWEDEQTSSASVSPTQLGQNLAANHNLTSAPVTSTSRSSAPANTSYSFTSANVSSTTGNLTFVSMSSTGSSASATALGIAATVSASNQVLSNLTNPSKTLSVIDVSALSISSVSLTSTATQGVITGMPSAVATYSAPHYVIYSDYWLFSMPDVSSLKSFNRFVLAFWMSDQGPVDNAQMWTWMSQSDRQKTLDAYHKAGIALMVSAFGSTDQPTTWGKDPIETAQGLAKFVIAYQFDGVDIDYEDMGAMNSDQAEAWLIPFQRELRRLLPSPYLISHAPVAPWFTSSNAYRSGAYVAIHQSVGSGIDFYNMQFYNQGDGVYTDCTTLITQSGGYWPGTSVMEMNSYAKVPLNKIVIGKPLDADKASNGYMGPQDLNTCVKLARTKGWNGGVMFWEWTTAAPGIMAAARA